MSYSYYKELLLGSFVPIILVIFAIFTTILFVEYKAVQSADRATVIEIQEIQFIEGEKEDEPTVEAFTSAATGTDPLFIEASDMIVEKRWAAAEKLYLKRIKEKPSSSVYNDLGILYDKKGDYNNAIKTFSNALVERPVYAYAYFNRALTYLKLNEPAKAIEDYQTFIKKMPNNYEGHFNLGLVLLRNDYHGRAVLKFKKAADLSASAKKVRALYYLGLALRDSGTANRSEALLAFTETIRLKPDHIKARIAIAMMERRTKKGKAKTLEAFEKIFKLNPNYTLSYFHYGRFHSSVGDIDNAIMAYKTAIKLNPDYIKAHYNLGLIYLGRKERDKARNHFNSIVSQNNSHSESHFNLGRIAFMEGSFQAAIKHYRTAIKERTTSYPEAYINIGLAYGAQNKFNNAIKNYRTALSSRANYPEAWYNLGLIYIKQKKMELAYNAFKSALKDNPDYEQAWFNLGLVNAEQGAMDRAIFSYRKALRIRPDYPYARLNLGVLLAKSGKPTKAVKEYQKLLDKDDTYATAWLNLGFAFMDINNFKDAAKAFKKVIELEPDSTKAML
ncbi:MAG: tetratricopeptide repeat protein, partial [Thermodesulfobacteriota bacterium]